MEAVLNLFHLFCRWSKVNVPKALLSDILPGPVTVVLERSADLNPNLNPGTQLVGIRIPNHEFMIELARECSGPIALTSANISNSRSSLSIEVSHIQCLRIKINMEDVLKF